MSLRLGRVVISNPLSKYPVAAPANTTAGYFPGVIILANLGASSGPTWTPSGRAFIADVCTLTGLPAGCGGHINPSVLEGAVYSLPVSTGSRTRVSPGLAALRAPWRSEPTFII